MRTLARVTALSSFVVLVAACAPAPERPAVVVSEDTRKADRAAINNVYGEWI